MKPATALAVIIAGAILGAVSTPAAERPLEVGIVPFDVVSVEGAGGDVSQGMAKLTRIELVRNSRFRPRLLTVTDGAQSPQAVEKISELGRLANVDVVLVGTVLDAGTSHSRRHANTGGVFGVGVGGSITRTSAHVSLHVELVDPASASVVGTFEVEGSASGTGVGADLSTALGSVNTGDAGENGSPMAKALREAAQRIAAEMVKREPKLRKP